MPLKELLQTMLGAYPVITTGIITSTYVFCQVFNNHVTFSIDDIGGILVMAFFSDLPFLLFFSKGELTKKEMRIRFIIHIPVLLFVLLYFAGRWNWINIKNPKEVAFFILLVIGVYAVVFAVTFYKDKKTADKLNDSLKRRYHM